MNRIVAFILLSVALMAGVACERPPDETYCGIVKTATWDSGAFLRDQSAWLITFEDGLIARVYGASGSLRVGNKLCLRRYGSSWYFEP